MIPKRGKSLFKIVIFCRVYPLARPRFNNNSVYQPKENQRELLYEISKYTELLPEKIQQPIVVDIEITFARKQPGRRGAKFEGDYPTDPSFGDEDNLRKAVNDGLVSQNIIHDDRIIIGGSTFKIFGNADQLTINIYGVKQ